jgi:large subunit ribosomal protein L21
MYAVFEDGSRQYRVSEGDVVQVDFRDLEIGANLEFQRVLLFQGTEGVQIGQPMLEGARVLGKVVDHPSTKLYIQHFRRRKNYRRLRGHRQPYTAVQIRSILLKGMEPPPEPAAPPDSRGVPQTETAAATSQPLSNTAEEGKSS